MPTESAGDLLQPLRRSDDGAVEADAEHGVVGRWRGGRGGGAEQRDPLDAVEAADVVGRAIAALEVRERAAGVGLERGAVEAGGGAGRLGRERLGRLIEREADDVAEVGGAARQRARIGGNAWTAATIAGRKAS
jgi:hypothetical protein